MTNKADQSFETIAEFYEVFSDGEARLKKEGPLLSDLLSRAPGRKVADIACGTGLHAEYLASLGANVTALDLSEEMIHIASKRHEDPNIEYRTGDMREVVGGPWDFVLCIGNSISLLAVASDVERMFRSVASCLNPEGLFLVHSLNYSSQTMREPRHRIERKTMSEREIIGVKSLVPADGKTLLTLSFFALGESIVSVSETAILTHFSEAQIVKVAEESGLTLLETYGGFNRSPFSETTSVDWVGVFVKSS